MNSGVLPSIPLDLDLSPSERGLDCQEVFCLAIQGQQSALHRVQFKQQGYHPETYSSRFVVEAEVIIFLITPSRGIHVYPPQITHQFAFHFLITSPIN